VKIAVTAKGNTLEDQVDPRFGRCPYFLVVDTETMDFKAIENANSALGGGAGIQSGQLMAEHDVEFVLTGNCGPNAFQTLEAAGIQVIVGVSGTSRRAVEQFRSGALSTSSDANVRSHFGMNATGAQSSGQNMQMQGGKRGAGRGMGGAALTPAVTGQPLLESLKAQAQAMEEQLETIRKQIDEARHDSTPTGLVAVVDLEKCIACGTCQKACPTAAIAINKGASVDPAKCNGCSRCVTECPQGAISLHKAV